MLCAVRQLRQPRRLVLDIVYMLTRQLTVHIAVGDAAG